MAEHWIDARQALEIAGDPISLCTRLHAGLITARARTFATEREENHDVAVPKLFWWAKGHEALKQNWGSGDFSTWIEQKHQLFAFGVTFPLSEVLEMVPFERRALIAHGLSVAASPDWIAASDVHRLTLNDRGHVRVFQKVLIEQAKLGFVSARAVSAHGKLRKGNSVNLFLDEREWNVPAWFWQEFTKADTSNQSWETGAFKGVGRSPMGRAEVTLSGVHFLRESIERRLGPSEDNAAGEAPSGSSRGRRPTYDWATATAAVWGKLFRSEIIPEVQADIEKALIDVLTVGDKSPSPSTVRPFAKPIWEEFQKA